MCYKLSQKINNNFHSNAMSERFETLTKPQKILLQLGLRKEANIVQVLIVWFYFSSNACDTNDSEMRMYTINKTFLFENFGKNKSARQRLGSL